MVKTGGDDSLYRDMVQVQVVLLDLETRKLWSWRKRDLKCSASGINIGMSDSRGGERQSAPVSPPKIDDIAVCRYQTFVGGNIDDFNHSRNLYIHPTTPHTSWRAQQHSKCDHSTALSSAHPVSSPPTTSENMRNEGQEMHSGSTAQRAMRGGYKS